jgi:hypothetical protein
VSPASPPTPDEEEPAPPARKMLGWAFWAAVTFGLVCILMGAVVGIWGSHLVPPRPIAQPPPRPVLTQPAPRPGLGNSARAVTALGAPLSRG